MRFRSSIVNYQWPAAGRLHSIAFNYSVREMYLFTLGQC